VNLRIRIVLDAIAALLLSSLAMAQMPHPTPFSANMQINYGQDSESQQWHGKLYVGSEHMRFDLQNPPHEGPNVLTNFATQTDDVLLPEMKAYLEHPVGDPHARGPAAAMRDLRAYDPGNPCANQANMSCKKIGAETLEGRSCDHWELTRHGKVVNLWLDQKLHFPLKTVTEDATVTLTNVKEGAQDAARFQIPGDYKKMNMNPPTGAVSGQPRP
jgi:hypothetical protein